MDVAIMELQAKTEDARKKNEEEKKKKEEFTANAKAVKETIDKLEKQRKQEPPPATKEEIHGRKCTETPKGVPDASWKPKGIYTAKHRDRGDPLALTDINKME